MSRLRSYSRSVHTPSHLYSSFVTFVIIRLSSVQIHPKLDHVDLGFDIVLVSLITGCAFFIPEHPWVMLASDVAILESRSIFDRVGSSIERIICVKLGHFMS